MTKEELIAQRQAAMKGLTIMDNNAPIELVWEDLLDDVQLEVVGVHMPVLRQNWLDKEVDLATYLTEIDQVSLIEKSHNRWQDSLIIRSGG